MANHPGEENVATLFGDIHYFYGPPDHSPPHHRFDKGSYVYLFENANDRRARIEIANKAGTEEQDSFDGFLDKTQVKYSYRHQCLVSLTVGEASDPNEWHLPTFDPHNQNKYHYPLHSLDIYFWTTKDALQFLNGIRRVLPQQQVDVEEEPAPPPHPTDASSVVQQLETIAITDPTYTSPIAAQVAPIPQAPPLSAVSNEPAPQTSYAPIPYNPAAPAAPETIRHREKTPPPDDGIDPLAQAIAYDNQAPFSPGFVPPPGFLPGQQPGLASPGLPPPPSVFGAQPGLQRSQTMPQQQQVATPPVHTETSPPPLQASPPTGGYSSYAYTHQPQQQPDTSIYAMHQQHYQPTEAEAHKYKGRKEPTGRLEANAGRLERGMTGMFKKFEKKFG
ncbi:Putative pectate lyase F [Verticillium dahliae VDG2]|nr:Putative pectate lyase F [Verticillium dahliae VDG2]